MNGRTQILIVNSDNAILEIFSKRSELLEEFVSTGAECGYVALEKARHNDYDLIVLDLDLPDMDGREVCKQIRRIGVRSPIIMMIDVEPNTDPTAILKLGADDCITKPFKFIMLLSKIRTHIWQHEGSGDLRFTVGPYIFYPSKKVLENAKENKKIRLTAKETAILRFLLRAGDRVTGRDVLLDEVWGYNSNVTTHTLETHVYRLRQKIEFGQANAQILVTEPGGYKLVT